MSPSSSCFLVLASTNHHQIQQTGAEPIHSPSPHPVYYCGYAGLCDSVFQCYHKACGMKVYFGLGFQRTWSMKVVGSTTLGACGEAEHHGKHEEKTKLLTLG